MRAVSKAIALTAMLAATSANSATILGSSATPTLIGSVVAGQTYVVTASGVMDGYVGFNGGAGLTFTADGKPTYAFPSPYAPFYPSGLDYDPSSGPSAYGKGGAGKLMGALLGTFTATPSGPADYFMIGLSYQFTAAVSGNLYGLANDCPNCYGDNGGGFEVTLAPLAAVPEPAAWAMMIVGFGLAGGAMRRRRSAVAFA